MYNKNFHIHFVGIGGIGMSGIATILTHQGYIISGCDTILDQKSIQNLLRLGCTIYEGNNTHQCADPSIAVLVYSSAIQRTNPEIQAARARGIPTIPRALMLAELMRTKYSIAIAGSHGKTTTTSMLSHILLTANYDPTVIIGGHLKTISHNAHYGIGDFLVAEADESDRSLIQLHATLALITNIDLEHLETYTCIDDIKQTFLQFINNIPFYGKAYLCIDDSNTQSLSSFTKSHVRIATYGFNPEAHTSARDVHLGVDYTEFTVLKHGIPVPGTIRVNMPGKHNAQNALGAIALAQELNVPFETIIHALGNFPGVERRFSYHGIYKGAEIFDDYGHHPKEIESTLAVAHTRAHNKVTVVFQPHRYTRTKFLWNDFIKTFLQSPLKSLIITDIYSASESPLEGITSEQFVASLKSYNPSFPVYYVPYDSSHTQLKKAIDADINQGDLVLLLGAGQVYTIANQLCQSPN